MPSNNPTIKSLPWYRYPAVWVIIALPIISIIMSFWLLFEAITSTQSPPIESYFKKGLTPNQLAEKEENAKEMGLTGNLLIHDNIIDITLNQDMAETTLTMIFRHPTLAEKDFSILLRKSANRKYSAELPKDINQHKWDIFVKSIKKNWQIEVRRLVGENNLQLTPYGD